MSVFTDRLYRAWSAQNGDRSAKRIDRVEGYPTHHTKPPGCVDRVLKAKPLPCSIATPRDGLPRAKDAATRPEKPVLLAHK